MTQKIHSLPTSCWHWVPHFEYYGRAVASQMPLRGRVELTYSYLHADSDNSWQYPPRMMFPSVNKCMVNKIIGVMSSVMRGCEITISRYLLSSLRERSEDLDVSFLFLGSRLRNPNFGGKWSGRLTLWRNGNWIPCSSSTLLYSYSYWYFTLPLYYFSVLIRLRGSVSLSL